MAKVRAATNQRVEALSAGWEFCEIEPGSGAPPTSPAELDARERDWSSASCPGTVASALRAQGKWDFQNTRNFDGSDWWYRIRFSSTPSQAGEALALELDGLATLAEVWLNGVHVLSSDNMFCAHELDVTRLIVADNLLCVRFASLELASLARRPRPRFKTRLIERQQLRFFRTTLLGRIPGWTPPVTAVGPWRGVRLARRRAFQVRRAELCSRIEGGRALVRAHLELELLGAEIASATLHVASHSRVCSREAGGTRLDAELEVPDAQRWWPNGHGPQPLYPARVSITLVGGETHELQFGALAFRSVVLDTNGDRFALIVNDHELRCRGACWTPCDVVSLEDEAATVSTLEQVHAAGMNMVRVGGTMVYESDAFYEACDRLGIMVWQDFMFANCDYPVDDANFRASVTREAEQFLGRTETRACLTVLCGNSEIEQQAAMLGLPRETWKSPLFEQLLRGVTQERRRDVPYVTSTPTGGSLPFQANAGLTHYYGVGAYLRPLEDARRADVKFTPECLGFANIPEESTIELVLGDGRAPFHNPRWKARVPRDSGAGWDFDDVRDHYTRLLFGIDPSALRYADVDRALALGRITSGEVMARTLSEWRRGASNCRGALIWFLRDLWPGAGWGLIDSQGLPKAAYYYVKRAMQPQTLFFSDEGLNGLALNLINDQQSPLRAELSVELIRNGCQNVATGKKSVEVPARGTLELDTSTLFEHFMDLSYAYRFGPSQYDVAVARLSDDRGSGVIAEACHFPRGLSAERAEDLGLEAIAEELPGNAWQLCLESKRFAHAVAIDLPGFASEDCYFDVVPGRRRVLRIHPKTAGAKPRGFVRPLNAQGPTRIAIAALAAGQP